ncbi:hypothetical protein ACC684_37685, partial [Rhizobium ruizarguesonis]
MNLIDGQATPAFWPNSRQVFDKGRGEFYVVALRSHSRRGRICTRKRPAPEVPCAAVISFVTDDATSAITVEPGKRDITDGIGYAQPSPLEISFLQC